MFSYTGSVMEPAAHLKDNVMPPFVWTPSDRHCEPLLMRISQWCQVKGAELFMIFFLHQCRGSPLHHYETLFS